MSSPRHQIRAFLDDGPHSGRTVSIDCDPDGRAPERFVLTVASGGSAVAASVTYVLHDADEELGLWAYRTAGGR